MEEAGLDVINQPWAYAYDGFPIYSPSPNDNDGENGVADLDSYDGHTDRDGNYHYHAKQPNSDPSNPGRPYVTGGLAGIVSGSYSGNGYVVENGGHTPSHVLTLVVFRYLSKMKDLLILVGNGTC